MSSLETLSKLIIKEFNTKELQEIPEDLETTVTETIKKLQVESNSSELQQQINLRNRELLDECHSILIQIRRDKDKQEQKK